MRFLYRIKNCSSCKYNSTCDKETKNSPETLGNLREFEHISRSTKRYGIKPLPKIQSFCIRFAPMEKEDVFPITKEEREKRIEPTEKALDEAMRKEK